MWTGRLQESYDGDYESWVAYAEMYGLAAKLGYDSEQEAWDANPVIQVSSDPKDFGRQP